MELDVESLDFRKAARANCYKYGPLYIYSSQYISLDKHSFPSYQSKEGTGAVEKFMALMQSLGSIAGDTDASAKMSKPLPGVTWGGDKLDVSFSLSGTMYFIDYTDYVQCKERLLREFKRQGWVRNISKGVTKATSTYKPAIDGNDALYADDPTDAAGMAMMANAMQNLTTNVDLLVGRITENTDMYAEGYARSYDGASSGILGNIEQGFKAMGANFNAGIAGKWELAGWPIELKVEGVTVAKSVPCVLQSDATFAEKKYIVDNESNGRIYPTEMDVSITVSNLYGSLLTTSAIK